MPKVRVAKTKPEDFYLTLPLSYLPLGSPGDPRGPQGTQGETQGKPRGPRGPQQYPGNPRENWGTPGEPRGCKAKDKGMITEKPKIHPAENISGGQSKKKESGPKAEKRTGAKSRKKNRSQKPKKEPGPMGPHGPPMGPHGPRFFFRLLALFFFVGFRPRFLPWG